jgi:hypothetical protein
MRKIEAYKIGADTTVEIPIGAVYLCAEMRRGELTIWMSNPESSKPVVRRFVAKTTHGQIPNEAIYIGSAQSDRSMTHVFEVPL